MTETRNFHCDLCGANAPVEISCAAYYTGGQPLHVCTKCGFIYVQTRRTSRAIAKDWSDNKFGPHDYTAHLPAIKSRQTYVAEMMRVKIGTRGKLVCDIGGGEGQFLDIISGPEYGAKVFAIEPSELLCKRMSARGISNFAGTAEQYIESAKGHNNHFDIVTIIWTLENCQNANSMLQASSKMLKPRGHLVIATGSRILVPFKKPLNYYLNKKQPDNNCFRFSVNTLHGILAENRFTPEYTNRYIDHDVLCVISKKSEKNAERKWSKDDYREVLNFFDRWHAETQKYYYSAPEEKN